MSFTSNIFLIGVLPWFLLLYYLFGIKNDERNIRCIFILLANAIFYIWGGIGAFVYIIIYSVIVYILGIAVLKIRKSERLAISLIVAVIPLVTTKYIGFVIHNLNFLCGLDIESFDLIVPVGISFFTFEALSYLIDVYNEKITDSNLLDVLLYLSFFPTVTSGPIIRYNEFVSGINQPILQTGVFLDGIERIVIGLCKKVLIADKIAALANYYFDGVAVGENYSVIGLWIGSIAYTIQLYFDFSGYSDMAIGIGKVLGISIRENFNKPYQASCISDFWRRWHISLTFWFRDYIYIPLGGNRCKVPRHIFNMLVVWMVTGIWHGADWTFLIWGLSYWLLLVIEKYVPFITKINHGITGRIYTLFFVNLLWVPFRATNMSVFIRYFRGMFGEGTGHIEDKAICFLPLLFISISLCFPWDNVIFRFKEKKAYVFVRGVMLIFLFVLALSAVINSTYTPYIYGNF